MEVPIDRCCAIDRIDPQQSINSQQSIAHSNRYVIYIRVGSQKKSGMETFVFSKTAL
jgi:hypothetical protein